MTDKEKIIDGVDVSEWTDEEVRYKFEKHSPKAIRQIAFDLYKQLKHYKQALNEIENYVRDNSDFDKSDKLTSNTGAYDILEIIKKQRRTINDR